MADTKATGLTEHIGPPADDDMLYMADVSDTTMAASGTSKKNQGKNYLRTNGTANTLGANIAANGYSFTGAGTVAASVVRAPSYYGGTASGGTVTFSSTSHATKGKIVFGAAAYDEENGRFSVGNSSPTYTLEVLAGSAITNIVSVAQAGVSNGFTITSNGSKHTYTLNDVALLDIKGPTTITTTGASENGLIITKTNGSDTGFGVFIRSARAQSSSFYNILTYADYDGTPDPRFYVDGAGACAAYSFPNLSDGRLKDLDKPITGVLDKVKDIKAYRFAWKNGDLNNKHIGFVAQEIAAVFPECVSKWPKFDKDGKEIASDLLAVDYTKLVPVLMQAVNELASRVIALEVQR